ncbi:MULTISPECIES: zinc-binding dehydrogenase [Arthrobacter]|uniref:Zinc-binding dehydrogenase n=2 Tax=Arthrobacter TaxID=1663 RepID=A0ABU9KNV7_9MICC|nr:zinc-binding dehydrogenase [Arthrobacter sp. YJM1]MDP5227564.1 alcohol dehydrogenase catalytic domain-containing protein [Arthrobacter sp. YJM1]
MSNTVTAGVFRPGTGLALEELNVAAPGPGLVEVELRATGVCHSDLHVLDGAWPAESPLVMGHEGAGVVRRIGKGVDQVTPGTHVVLSWFAPCRRCRNCAAGKAWLCTGTTALANTLPDGGSPFTDSSGARVDPYLGLGTFSGTVVVPESALVPVPEEIPFSVGALMGCSVTTGVGAVLNTATVRPGESAVVFGCGGVGLAVVMGLSLVGAGPIVAVDLSEERLERAREFGATVTLNPRTDDVAAVLQERFSGVDYAFEAIGNPGVISTLGSVLAPGGAAVLVGMTAVGATATIDPFDLADQGKRILGCNYGSSVAAVDVPRLARLFLDGKLPLDRLISSERPLGELSAAVEELRAGEGLRSVLVP